MVEGALEILNWGLGIESQRTRRLGGKTFVDRRGAETRRIVEVEVVLSLWLELVKARGRRQRGGRGFPEKKAGRWSIEIPLGNTPGVT